MLVPAQLRAGPQEPLAQQLTGGMQALALWWDENLDVPRTAVVDSAMDFCWLGLERVRDGQHMRPDGKITKRSAPRPPA